MATLPNACAFSVSNTPGTGSGFAIAAVASGPYRIPRASEDGAEAFLFVREGDTWEICESAYDHATTTWSRGALSDSSGASVARQWMVLHTRCYPMMTQRDRPVWDDVMQAQAAAGAAIIQHHRDKD